MADGEARLLHVPDAHRRPSTELDGVEEYHDDDDEQPPPHGAHALGGGAPWGLACGVDAHGGDRVAPACDMERADGVRRRGDLGAISERSRSDLGGGVRPIVQLVLHPKAKPAARDSIEVTISFV